MPVAQRATRCQLSDPLPDLCSGCHKGVIEGDRFVDFDAAHDSGVVVNDQGAVVLSADDLHLCEQCVRDAAECLGYKPKLHREQLAENQRLEADNELWRNRALTLKETLDKLVKKESTRDGVAG